MAVNLFHSNYQQFTTVAGNTSTRPVLAILVALLIVIAGCSTNQPTAPPTTVTHTETPEQTTVSTTTTPTTTTTITTTATTVPETSTVSNSTRNWSSELVNLTPEKKANISDTIHSLYSKVNESNRRQVTADAAQEICSMPKIDKSALSNASKADREFRRIYHGAKVWNSHFSSKIDPARVEAGIDVARKAGKYAPVVGNYNRLNDAACNYSTDDPESRREFYLSTTAFGIELALIQNSVFWRGASAATRTLSHTAPYKMVQSVFGDAAYGFVMSETYWLIHGSLLAADDFALDHANEMNMTWNQSQINTTDIKSQINSTHRLVQNVSLEGTISNVTRLANKTSMQEIVGCAEEIAPEAGEDAKKLPGILFDLQLSESEWDRLSNSTKSSIESCLLDNSTK